MLRPTREPPARKSVLYFSALPTRHRTGCTEPLRSKLSSHLEGLASNLVMQIEGSPQIGIVNVVTDGSDGILVTFADGTTAGYVVEELL
jgi:hypothetical protein